ncbi:MAG: aminotransferase class V-fold PLP-dependent enzyme [Flavobacteriales bacterium]|nr:aminotransferase class V-fold PLP-dependent enzyme [Bacteroidota bacterium]MCB9241493.1 aminotransferase class V-fold PLP-dependent enzyme [Flavobacteriales bacterium]
MTNLSSQRHAFQLDNATSYLNAAYMAPMPNATASAVEESIKRMQHPHSIVAEDWFEPVNALRQKYGEIIGTKDWERIAITPSCSYGIANVAKHIKPFKGSNIVVTTGQFPSNYYTWAKVCGAFHCELRSVDPPKTPQRGRIWNERILDAIDSNTCLVSLPPLFHADGTRFQLEAVRTRCHEVGARLIVDGTQLIGAGEWDMETIQPDALICSGYKWLLGPYGTGMAFYGPAFDDASPIEENWVIRTNSHDFRTLLDYSPDYRPVGMRLSSGEHAAFLHIPALLASASLISNWSVNGIASYTTQLFEPFETRFRELGCVFEEETYRYPHLLGIRFEQSVDLEQLNNHLRTNGVYVSVRDDVIRISLHVWNTTDDLEKLLQGISTYLKSRNVTL